MTYNQPNQDGKFGEFGGRYVAETLMPAVLELGEAYEKIKNDAEFQKEFAYYLKNYVGRPSPLYLAERLTKKLPQGKKARKFKNLWVALKRMGMK